MKAKKKKEREAKPDLSNKVKQELAVTLHCSLRRKIIFKILPKFPWMPKKDSKNIQRYLRKGCLSYH